MDLGRNTITNNKAFTNLRLGTHKALEDCLLQDLGKINIICGKNNSGKSTLLEAITKGDRTPAITLNEEELKHIYDRSIGNTSWSGSMNYETQNAMFKDMLSDVAKTKDLWYEDHEGEFSEGFYKLFNNARFQWSHRADIIIQAYRELYQTFRDISTVLVPPKRQIPLGVSVNSSEVVQPTGTGILNYLFYAKNQQDSSDDNKVFGQIRDAFTKISSRI